MYEPRRILDNEVFLLEHAYLFHGVVRVMEVFIDGKELACVRDGFVSVGLAKG